MILPDDDFHTEGVIRMLGVRNDTTTKDSRRETPHKKTPGHINAIWSGVFVI
jgi:hypothetical protein